MFRSPLNILKFIYLEIKKIKTFEIFILKAFSPLKIVSSLTSCTSLSSFTSSSEQVATLAKLESIYLVLCRAPYYHR